ncbi:hypothetical protein SAMN06265182_1509 [Persephonella hydrogeniphila]|uniref:Uncharacterized protein n=1 Tax=Persephonella hydrogeniphila TaxID=198703 RepID=A0A285NIQ7_9AQUI|nr:hypothetical protein [Persephonella hydrogeniphila]SNZ09392.1 hypothetical protein SAMN06265182_1509 [Persephonella hydrogeniphila]
MKKILILSITLIFALYSYGESYTDLYRFLVDIKGWKGEKPTGSKMAGPFGVVITAERDYSKNEKQLEITVIKGSMATAMMAPFSMVTEMDTPEEYVKVFKFNGFKTGLSHNKKSLTGEIIVFLTPDSVFSMKYSGMHYKEALDILKKFPLKELSQKLMEM